MIFIASVQVSCLLLCCLQNGRKRTLASRLSGYVQRKGAKRPRTAAEADDLTVMAADDCDDNRTGVAAAGFDVSPGGDAGIMRDAGEEERKDVCQYDMNLPGGSPSAPTNTKPSSRTPTVTPSIQTPVMEAASPPWTLTVRGGCAGEGWGNGMRDTVPPVS